MSEISNVCNAVEGHCIQAMKIVHHHANDRFDWLISGLNPSREAISILSGKYKRFWLELNFVWYKARLQYKNGYCTNYSEKIKGKTSEQQQDRQYSQE